MKKLLAVAVIMWMWMTIFGSLTGPVEAAEDTVEFTMTIDTSLRGNSGGFYPVRDLLDIPPGWQDVACVVSGASSNNQSVHTVNDLYIRSNGDAVVLPDVEREGGFNETAEGSLTLGPTVWVEVLLGYDDPHPTLQFFSARVNVRIVCQKTTEPPVTSTTTPDTTTTSQPQTSTTTSLPSTTTTPPNTTQPVTTTGPSTTTSVPPTTSSVPQTTTSLPPTAQPPPTHVDPPPCDENSPTWNTETETCELPFTGFEPLWWLAAGAFALAGGAGALKLGAE